MRPRPQEMSDPKGPFEAAVRAGCDADVWAIDGHTRQPIQCRYPACGKYCPSAKTAEAAIRGALPPDPAPDEVSLAIGLAVHDVHEFPAKTYLARVGQAARRALRASLLPGEEPS